MNRLVGRAIVTIAMLVLGWGSAQAQLERDSDTMLPADAMRAIANEISGTRAYENVLDIAGYEHIRPAEEYSGTYREATVAEGLAKQYGFSNVRITRLPVGYKQWAGQEGELWVTTPKQELISRYLDNEAMLVFGSQTADITAPLVWVGLGAEDSDYAGKDVKGKIVLTNGHPRIVHDLAVAKYGAAGVVSFDNQYGFGLDRPDEVAEALNLSNGTREDLDSKTTFAIELSQRQGTKLLQMVEAGPVTVHVKTKSTRYPAEHQVVEGWIPGDGSSDQEVVIVAHLFEGIAKQGATDNMSGSAAALEIGRAWIKLINDGVLKRPKRTVHFLWVPEIIYATEYWKKFPDFPKHVIAMTSIDITGLNETINHDEQRVLLTPDSFPSFLNDLYTQYLNWMQDTQAIKYNNLLNTVPDPGRYFQDPITDPQGTQDPYHVRILAHAGGSDHLPFLRSYPRVAGVHFMTWPGIGYHTSEDKPQNLDPTQLKRSSMVAMCVSLVMANASPEDALLVAGLATGNATERIGKDLTKASEALRAAPDKEAGSAYKDGLVLIRQAYKREAADLASTALLMNGDAKALASLKDIENSLALGEPADIAKLQSIYKAVASERGETPDLNPPMSPAEAAASKIYPHHSDQNPYDDFSVGGGGAATASGQPSMHPGHSEYALYDEEAINFADGSRSVLEIRDALSAELGPIGVGVVEKFFRDLTSTGKWTVTAQAGARTGAATSAK